MFEGLMSRWMMPFWWACWMAWQTLDEEFEPFRVGVGLVAVLGDRDAADQFHHEVGPPAVGGAGVETLAMFGWSISASAWRSASKRATTCLGVHAQLDDLERHAPRRALSTRIRRIDSAAALKKCSRPRHSWPRDSLRRSHAS
jgi:hypothetical protein